MGSECIDTDACGASAFELVRNAAVRRLVGSVVLVQAREGKREEGRRKRKSE